MTSPRDRFLSNVVVGGGVRSVGLVSFLFGRGLAFGRLRSGVAFRSRSFAFVCLRRRFSYL